MMINVVNQTAVSYDHRVFEHLPIGVCIIQQDGTVLVWNGRMSQWTGSSNQTMIGQNILTLFPDFVTSGYWQRVDHVFEGGSPVSFSAGELRRQIEQVLKTQNTVGSQSQVFLGKTECTV